MISQPRKHASDQEDHAAEQAEPKVTYGYGHRAHSPDPNATYVFNPGQPRTLPRTLPEDRKKRWKVPG